MRTQKDKICSLSTKKADDIPFDLKHRRHIVHRGSIQMLKARILEELEWARREIDNVRRSHIQVKLQPVHGKLATSKFYAKAELYIRVDLLNDSSIPSAEIDAAYFYAAQDWTLSQDGRTCSSTESDIPKFSRRYFLTRPVRRIQNKLMGAAAVPPARTLATTFAGDKLQDEYTITGRAVLRLVTSEGNVDYELRIETTVDELPF